MVEFCAVQLRNVTKRIGNKTIVDHLSIDIPKGEVFGLLGPNGAGKTTTIRMMVGLISISEGQVLIHGKDVRTHFSEAMQHVGCIVENPELYKYMSGYQNLKHMARMAKPITNMMIDDQRIKEVVELVGLTRRIHDKVKTYSLGMRQRLGLAQALLHRPSVLILDEPTNGLDPAGIRELRDHVRSLAKNEGMAVIVSSHLLSEMELMCDRVAIISHGSLIQIQTSGDAVAHKDGQQIVHIEVSDPARAAEVLNNALGLQVTAEDDTRHRISFQASRDVVADSIDALIHAGIRVYATEVERRTLEDRFLEVTGGESIA